MHHTRFTMALVLLLAVPASSRADVLVRWTQDHVPSPHVLGISTLVVPADKTATAREALTQGYRLYIEADAASLATRTLPAAGIAGVVVRGSATRAQLAALRQRLASRNARVFTVDERGKWPHIRSNWVTKNNDILQVAGRSAQPWIETNAALIRIAAANHSGPQSALTYPWVPLTVSDADEGPALENYLVAIAEAGSFGANLLLPLHDRFQRRLLLGEPRARRDWSEIRRYLEFYAENLPRRYEPVATLGVVTSAPLVWFEVMNLLSRHNLPFDLIEPSKLSARARAPLKLLVVLDALDPEQVKALADFERSGGRVVLVRSPDGDTGGEYRELTAAKIVDGVPDPNKFALEVRQMLSRGDRPLEIWNGITVLAAPYKEPDGTNGLLTVLNYAHQPLPVQLRVPGTFSEVHFETPEEPAALLAHEHRDGHTEFVVPALRVGGRIFLRRRP